MPRLGGLPRAFAVLSLAAAPAAAETSLNFYGAPGLIDMPSGRSAPDGEFSGTASFFGGVSRTTLSFQFSERLSASFRFSQLYGLNFAGFTDYSDRSFDIRYRLLDEGPWTPAVTIGLQDFLGTGIASAEYIAATKGFGERLTVTAGLGWGRFGTEGGLGAPFGPRPGSLTPTGGTPNVDSWFRGDVALFGGLEYRLSDRFLLKAEYSSDAYVTETGTGMIDRESPYNFGLEYHGRQIGSVGVYWLYGTTFGVKADIALHPKRPLVAYAGRPADEVIPRTGPASGWDTGWTADPAQGAGLRRQLAAALAGEGLALEALRLSGSEAVVHVRNPRYDRAPQAIGRAVREMANLLPPSVETFRIVPHVNGVPVSTLTIRRSEIDALATAEAPVPGLVARPEIGPGLVPAAEDRIAGLYPRFSWAVRPEITYTWFDPRNPVIWDKVVAEGKLEPAPGVVLRGAVGQRLSGRYRDTDYVSNSSLPAVRTDAPIYAAQGETVLENLTASYYFRPGADLYGRVTAGYLERMFGGVSAELLWKPAASRLALGAEANWVKKRAYDGGFGFLDYEVATGHLSAYYDFGGGYEGAVHAGRYLAGDWGATVSVGRRFETGMYISAFATRTDVSFDDFGEGSFDKGIRIEIPLSYVTGKPSRVTAGTTIRSIQRDGGARLEVDGRLYDSIRDYHARDLTREWGALWQ